MGWGKVLMAQIRFRRQMGDYRGQTELRFLLLVKLVKLPTRNKDDTKTKKHRMKEGPNS